MPQGPFPGGVTPGFPALQPPYSSVTAPFSGGVLDQASSITLGFSSSTVTIGGTIATGNTVTVTTNGVASVGTAIAADTPILLAGRVVSAINANAGVNTIVVASNAGTAAVTITSLTSGQPGMYALSSTAQASVTAVASYSLLDYAGVIIPTATFSYAGGNNAVAGDYGDQVFYYNTPYSVDSNTKADLRLQGLVL